MTDEQRAELKRLAEAATKGPWQYSRDVDDQIHVRHERVLGPRPYIGGATNGDYFTVDMRFIAAANPAAVLDLLTENERLRAALDVLERCAEAVIVDCVETRDVGGLILASEACTNARRLLES